MKIEIENLITILGMALVTYGTRVGGLWLMSRVTLSGRVERWLANLPGAVMMSIIAPALVSGGARAILAGIVTGLVAWRSSNLLLAMLAGVGMVLLLKTLGL
jgi:uncharacterized membrane protein